MGSPTIFSGNDTKSLKSNIDLNGNSKILSGTTDPSSVATSAPIGSIYLNSSNGKWYRKTDAGSSTNWTDMTLIRGVTDGSNAAAGFVGEYQESLNTTGANATGSVTWMDATSFSLTAGDWNVSMIISLDPNGSNCTAWAAGIGTASGNSSAGLTVGVNRGDFTTNLAVSISVPDYRVNITGTTTYYAKWTALYSSGTPRFNGCRISARRVR
jgi:hypothetical protein